jgi:DNA-binding beta-propeller fold protein YncE
MIARPFTKRYRSARCLAALVAGFLVLTARGYAETRTPLRLERTIALPGVQGRIDHLAVDLPGERLFVAALGNNTLEVIDLKIGKRLRSITSLNEPQGVLYLPELQKLFVTNGGDGSCRVFDANSLGLLDTVKFSKDADNIRFEPQAQQVYVGFGDGAIGAVDAKTGEPLWDVRLAGHPESFQLEQAGPRIFVNVRPANHIAVVDRKKRQVTAIWPLKDARDNYPMALDEANHRLFIGCRQPAKVIMYDTKSGKMVGGLEIPGDVDDVFYDAKAKRLYASCGEGFLSVFQQTAADHYEVLAKIATAKGARTSLLVPQQGRLYLAVPHQGEQPAEVRVYAVQP